MRLWLETFVSSGLCLEILDVETQTFPYVVSVSLVSALCFVWLSKRPSWKKLCSGLMDGFGAGLAMPLVTLPGIWQSTATSGC